MNTVLKTQIQSIWTGTIPDSPLRADVMEPISKDKMLVHKSRYVFKRVAPSNNNTGPTFELYKGRIMPHIEDITIIGEGGTLKAIYEQADEIIEHTLPQNELPFATIVQFTQIIKCEPPTDIQSSHPPTLLFARASQGISSDDSGSTQSLSSSASSATVLDQTLVQAQVPQSLSIASRPKRKLPSRIHSQIGASVAQSLRDSHRLEFSPQDESFLKRKRAGDGDGDSSSFEDVFPKPPKPEKRRRLVILSLSVVGVGLEFWCNMPW